MMNSIVVVKGSAYEQGVAHGKALAQVIQSNIKNVKAKLAEDHVGPRRYQAFVQKNAEFMQKNHPELIDEMRGIADGSCISFEDILTLNIPAYFMTKYLQQECSMIMVRGKATADGCTYLIKNRDMGTMIEQAVIKRENNDGTSIIEINGAGTVTYPANGINSYGLGIATTGFWSKAAEPNLDEVDATHIFVNIRLLLENCRTAKEVIEYLKTSPRMNGLNIIAVDEKNAFAIETTRDNMVIQEDDGSGVLYRTNHYTLEPITALNTNPDEARSSHMRFKRIGQMLEERYGRLRFQDLFRITSDHENGILSICRHPQGDVLATTVSSSLVCIEDREAWTTIGNPCENLRHTSLI